MATWFDNSRVSGQTLLDRFNGIAAALGLLAPKASPTFTGTVTAPTFSGALTGNASSATVLQTARTINGTSFDGSSNITVTAANPNLLTRGTYLTGSNYDGVAATTWAVDATTTNTASKVVARDGSGNFAAGTVTASLSGTASSATTLAAGSDRTKLDGVAAGATANSSDATLLSRANHTGAQAIGTVTGLQAALDAKAPTASPAFTGTAEFVLLSASGAIEIGSVNGTGSTPFIDFHAGNVVTNYDCRIIATDGTGTIGQGRLTYRAGQHAFIGAMEMSLTDAADDAAAAAAGVQIGALYRAGSAVKIRTV
jgi:hypothetical protein